MQKTTPPVKNPGIYLLPNTLTLLALFFGFYAVIAAMRSHYSSAAVAIFLAMLLDSLDGRIARLTNTSTAFGAQLDSLSDMVCFGLAPALVMYSWGLEHLGKLGWLTTFIYAIAVALRLARFNSQTEQSDDRRYFLGLPCPAAAGALAGFIWVVEKYNFPVTHSLIWIAALLSVILGLLMVSTLHYKSFKDSTLFSGQVSFLTILIIVFILVLIAVSPSTVLFTAFLVYSFSGPAFWCLAWWRRESDNQTTS